MVLHFSKHILREKNVCGFLDNLLRFLTVALRLVCLLRMMPGIHAAHGIW